MPVDRHYWCQWGLRRGVDLAMAALLIMGLAKVIDPLRFADSLRTWSLLPGYLVMPIAIALPTIEVAVSLNWFLGFSRFIAMLLATGMLVAFTGAYLVQTIIVGPPDCGCSGLLVEYLASLDKAGVIVGRNAVMLLLILVGLVQKCYLKTGNRRGQVASQMRESFPG